MSFNNSFKPDFLAVTTAMLSMQLSVESSDTHTITKKKKLKKSRNAKTQTKKEIHKTWIQSQPKIRPNWNALNATVCLLPRHSHNYKNRNIKHKQKIEIQKHKQKQKKKYKNTNKNTKTQTKIEIQKHDQNQRQLQCFECNCLSTP